jgi:outer membrane lipoprotein-sorting protein
MRPHRAGLVGLVLIFAGLGLAQSQQDALDILNKVGATYRGVKTLQAEGDVITGMTGPGMQQNMTTHILLTLTGSGKVRMESKTGMMNVLVISDGETTWLYMPALNRYSKLPVGQTAAAGNPSIPGALPGLSGVGDFGKIAANIKEARLVRSETLQLDGIATDCYVIDVIPAAPSAGSAPLAGSAALPKVEPISQTVWVDKSRLLVTRVSSRARVTMPGESAATDTQSAITFNKLTLDNPVPDDTFSFTPPPGATELDLSQFMPPGTTPQ